MANASPVGDDVGEPKVRRVRKRRPPTGDAKAVEAEAEAEAAKQLAKKTGGRSSNALSNHDPAASQKSALLGLLAQTDVAKALPEVLPEDFLKELGIDAQQWALLRAATGHGLLERAFAKTANLARAEAEKVEAEAKARAAATAAAEQRLH